VSELLAGGFLEECVDVFMKIPLSVIFVLDYMFEIMQCADLGSVVLECHWRVRRFSRFVVVVKVTSPKDTCFSPKYFYDPCQEYSGVDGLVWRPLGWVCLCVVWQEFDREVVSIHDFVWCVRGRIVNILVR
jgi:hypothetical protein